MSAVAADVAVLKDLVRVAVWLAFVGLGGLVVWAEHGRLRRFRRHQLVNLLLAYTLVVSFAAGLLHKDLWPFSAWSMFTHVRTATVGHLRIFGVTEEGAEYPADFRAWQPLQWEELLSWLEEHFDALSPRQKREAAEHLLDRMDHARIRVLDGDSPGYLDRYLGPLAAPEHLLHPATWRKPGDVPESPFEAILLVRETWNVDEGPRAAVMSRDTVYQWVRGTP